jgi:hypothetical protein
LGDLMKGVSEKDGIDVYAAPTGLTPEGVDLGSPRVRPLKAPKIALVTGEGMASYEVGEIWHLLDYRMGIPVSLVESDRVGAADLGRYTHLVLVDGDLKPWDEAVQGKVKDWVQAGGTLIAIKRSARWVRSTLLAPPKKENGEVGGTSRQVGRTSVAVQDPEVAAVQETAVADPRKGLQKGKEEGEEGKAAPPRTRYVDYEQERAKQLASGVILEGVLDPTHPIAFGYRDEKVALFRNNTVFLEASENPFENVVLYSEAPLISGYISPEKLLQLEGKAAVLAKRVGRGTVVEFAENPSFRGFWHGTQKLFLNAIFFGPLVKPTQPPSKWTE